MTAPLYETRADVAVVGGGLAGLATVLQARGLDVVLVHPARDRGSSNLARGGIAAALEGDVQEHIDDTCRAGAGLCDRRRVELLVSEGVDRVRELVDAGMSFDRDASGALSFALEAGHSRARILHANGDATGRALVRFLASSVSRQPRVRRAVGRMSDLLVDSEGRVAGVVLEDSAGVGIVRAPDVVLATGGLGALFTQTSNSPTTNGDGLAIAASVGARCVDVEFVQFHPTALDVPTRPMPLITEALRGAGATLVGRCGRRIMSGVHPDRELAPRDVVAREVWKRTSRGEVVYLDTSAVADLRLRFPSVLEACVRAEIDPGLIPVAPAAHFHMGGIEVDDDGRSSVEGLWACGEVASTGVHGANRLASNSLLEALVFGGRVGRALAGSGRDHRSSTSRRPIGRENSMVAGVNASIRSLFWEALGIERDGETLRQAQRWLDIMSILTPATCPTRRRLILAQMITAAALRREESRGGHFRTDFPQPLREHEHRIHVHYHRGIATTGGPLESATKS